MQRQCQKMSSNDACFSFALSMRCNMRSSAEQSLPLLFSSSILDLPMKTMSISGFLFQSFAIVNLRSHAVMKLERSNSIRDAQAVTPVTRRISLSVVSPHPPLGPLATEPMEMNQMNQATTEKYHFHFESNEVESVDDGDGDDGDEIQDAKTIDSVNHEDSKELVVGDIIGIQSLPELPGPEKLLQS